MRNRAKCGDCGDIIESLHVHDYVKCSCEGIAVDGGDSYFKCFARDWDKFIRLNDDDSEFIPEIKEKEEEKVIDEIPKAKPSKSELLDLLSSMNMTLENLPEAAMNNYVTHYDLLSFSMLVSAIFRCDCKDES